MEKLTDIYWQTFQEQGPMDLEDFLKQVKAGEHGSFSPQEIDDFIDEVLMTMLENIRLKASEAPQYEAMREQVEAETEEKMAQLKEKYGSG